MIKVLDTAMINKIAAGEVIERPVSVIKELVENSIDAKADSITVEIKDGGILQIRVTDNGKGIPKEQVSTAFLAHATSKITSIEDLESIRSLGFRGEALSSIASVSQVEINTKTADEDTGCKLEIHGGEIVSQREIGMTSGTSIITRNLFYNTPARRKFLKRSAIEAGYIYDMINKLAIGNTHIAFKYINGKTELQTNGSGDLKTTLLQIFGSDTVKSLVDLDYEQDGIRVTGLVGKPELNRGNRTHEHFFINGRFIKNELVSKAAEKVYATLLPGGKFPFYIIKMDIDPSLVDVNVHPSKLEIRFSNEKAIFDLITKAVEKALEKQILIPSFGFKPEKTNNPFLKDEDLKKIFKQGTFEELQSNKNETAYPIRDNSETVEYSDYIKKVKGNDDDDSVVYLKERTLFAEQKEAEPVSTQSNVKNISATETFTDEFKAFTSILPPFKNTVNTAETPLNKEFESYKIVGQVFGTYWIIESKGSMFIIDQHAAHERMLFEDLCKSYEAGTPVSQTLLQPIVLNLSVFEREVLEDNIELLEKMGYGIEFLGNDYALTAVPVCIKETTGVGFFLEIIDKLSTVEGSVDSLYELKLDVIATISCKAAVKAHDKLSYPEAKALIESMLQHEKPFTCPHGRPTIVEITKYELEKRFKRV